jgi:hypothetical protein
MLILLSVSAVAPKLPIAVNVTSLIRLNCHVLRVFLNISTIILHVRRVLMPFLFVFSARGPIFAPFA